MGRLRVKLLFACAVTLLLSATASAAGSAMVYENWDTYAINLYYAPGSGILMADDIHLAGTERQLDYYDFTVYAELGVAPYTVTSELYTDSGGVPGTPIPGTFCAHVVGSNGIVVLGCAPGSGAILPEMLWMVLSFSTSSAGWVIGEAAELGFTGDFWVEKSGGGWNFRSFGGWPYGGFEAGIWCRAEPKPPVLNLKWSQPPIEWDPNAATPIYCGWDEESLTNEPDSYWRAVADDFRCLGTMPITSVHWWGSYEGWAEPEPAPEEPTAWRIGFWSNVAADPGAGPNYSYPEVLLWEVEVPAYRVQTEWVGWDEFPEMMREACFQYYVDLQAEEYFWQGDFVDDTNDDIFWMSIAAIYPPDSGRIFPWGWKTRPWSWMDDAVVFEHYGLLEPGVVLTPAAITPIEDPVYGESYDVAFELDTDPNFIKWEQPYEGIRNWPHYEDEQSMGSEDANGTLNIWRLVADDWPCDQNSPITAIVWWGSYIGYEYEACQGPPTAPPLKPNYFWLVIWDDVPAGIDLPYSHPGQIIWEYRAADFDAVLVGYDKHPEEHADPPREPVFRYSVTIPRDQWFRQTGPEDVYWLSIVAVYDSIVVVDDMESYDTDTNLIYYTWKDGGWNWTGSVVDLGVAPFNPVLGGQQSMIYLYDNDYPGSYKYSEAEASAADLEVGSNWTQAGANVLALWFYGSADNDAGPTEQMYVGLEDSGGPGSYVQADYGNMNDIKKEEWQQWCIDLQHFANGGVDLTDVQTIYLGFGDRVAQPPGGSGVVHFDAIRLHDECPAGYDYDWGWTNHGHTFNDNAVAGHIDASGAWMWEELYNQIEESEDMSFVLFTDPDPNRGLCWNPAQCAGQPSGDATCDGWVNLADLFALKQHFGKSAPWTPPECCADYTQDGRINLADLFALKAGFGTGPYAPSTGNQNCP